MVISTQVIRADEMILSVLPIEFDWFGVGLKLPCKRIDSPLSLQFLINETEGLATAEELDIVVI